MKHKKNIAILLVTLSLSSYGDEMHDTASKQCFSLIKDQWPTKRIYLNTHDRIGFSGDNRYYMSGRCFEPVCTEPFSWFVYQVRYIEGRKAYITCTMKDAGEPVLDRYNDQNRFMPPG